MKTDKLFYQFFQNQPDILSEWIPEIPPDCQFDYSAPVVKEQEFRHDGVFTPRHADLSIPMVFIEAQMQPDDGLYSRFFAEIYLHLKQYPTNRPWRGILILKSRSQKLGSETPYQVHFQGQVYRLYLQDLIDQKDLSPNLALLRLLILPKKRVIEAAQAIINQAPNQEILRHRLDWVEAVLVKKFPQLSPEDILKMFNISVDDFSHTRFYKDVFKEGEQEGIQKGRIEGIHKGILEGIQKGIQKGIQEGRQEGIQEGRQEGRQEGETDLIIRQLSRRCGTLTQEQKAQIQSLTIPELETLAESLLDFTSLEDLQIWFVTIRANPPAM